MSLTNPIPRGIRETVLVTTPGQTVFGPFDFRLYDPLDLEVWATAPGGPALQLAPADFTVTPAAPALAFPALFTVKLAAALTTGSEIDIRGARIPERSTDVTRAGVLQSQAIERELDKITVVTQELRRDASRGRTDMMGARLRNLGNPILPQDAATKSYVDGRDAAETSARIAADAFLAALIDSLSTSGPSSPAYASRAAAAVAVIAAPVNFVITAGYAAPGDGGEAIYRRVAVQPGHAGKFQSADGAWWELGSAFVNAKMFGARGDLRRITGNVTIASGTGNLTHVGAAFTAADVGKRIVVPGAGAAGAVLSTTIAAFTDATHVTLSANAGTSLAAISKTTQVFTDDTAAINAAAAMVAGRGALLFPGGLYGVSSPITPPSFSSWKGDSPHLTKLVTADATGDVLSVSNGFFAIKGLGFDAAVPRTGGNYINLSASVFHMSDFRMDGAFQGLWISTPVSTVMVSDGGINTASASGIAIRLSGGVAIAFSDVVCHNDGLTHSYSCLYVEDGGDYSFDNCQFLAGNTGATLAPGTGQSVNYVRMSRCWFDTSVAAGLVIAPTGSGKVGGCDFDQCWASTSGTNGVHITASGAATVSGISITGMLMINNASSAIVIDGSGVSNINFSKNTLANGGGGNGVNLSGAPKGVRIKDNDISGFLSGMVFDGSAYNRLMIQGNALHDNTNNTFGSLAGAVSSVIKGNIGLADV